MIRLSAPIKQHWAEAMQLDFPQLMSDTAYKESHRAQMIVWGEQERKKDPGIFCRSAIRMANGKVKNLPDFFFNPQEIISSEFETFSVIYVYKYNKHIIIKSTIKDQRSKINLPLKTIAVNISLPELQ